MKKRPGLAHFFKKVVVKGGQVGHMYMSYAAKSFYNTAPMVQIHSESFLQFIVSQSG